MDLRVDGDNRITSSGAQSAHAQNAWDHSAEVSGETRGEVEFHGLSSRKKPAVQRELRETPIERKNPKSPPEPPRKKSPEPPQELPEEPVTPEPFDEETFQEMKERELRRKKRMRKVSLIAGLVFLVGILGFLVYRFIRVEKIVVQGNQELTADYITELSGIQMGQHIFTIDMDGLERGLSSDPRVEYEGMKYEFPNCIVLRMKECMPVARFDVDGWNLLIDENGKAISLSEESGDGFPLIEGMSVTKYSLGYPVRTDDTYKQKVLCELLGALEKAQYTDRIARIDISSVSNIKLYNQTGLEIGFGAAENFELKTKWMKAVVEKLAEQGLTQGKLDVYSGEQAIYSKSEESGAGDIILNYQDWDYTTDPDPDDPDPSEPVPEDNLTEPLEPAGE